MRRKLFAMALCLTLLLGIGIARYVYSQANGRPARPNAAGKLEPEALAFRIMLGRSDKAPTAWDGSISISSGAMTHLEGWRFRAGDRLLPPAGWKASSHAAAGNGPNAPVFPNGIVAVFKATPQSDVKVTTPQGTFDFKPADVTSDKPALFLQNAVSVERVAADTRIATTVTEDDYPVAATAPDGTTWIAYVAYQLGTGDAPILANYTQEPANFDNLVPKNNGDQVRLARIGADGTTYTDVAALTPPGEDVIRPAIAVDNTGDVWTVWSQNVQGNWDLYARRYHNGMLDPVERLTTDVGPDLMPVMAREENGNIWLAWQGFRNGQADIFVRSLPNGSGRWSTPITVSNSLLNDWDPAIACAHDGSVYVAWDTYDKGDYDVRMRRIVNGQADPVLVVANTPRFEARPSLACDDQNRVWVAYEVGSPEWGKDYGYLVQNQGNPLYINHTVEVRCFVGGKSFHTAGALAESFQAGSQLRAM
ncbi:MAG TPA: hypothetical protein VKU00_11890, partial [Chthonomonadaceae bacterium]|nr:hypothetical protein [Chthonomonadaceae bacterium]